MIERTYQGGPLDGEPIMRHADGTVPEVVEVLTTAFTDGPLDAKVKTEVYRRDCFGNLRYEGTSE